MISFIGALSEVGTRDINGSTYLDLSIDIGSIKRVSTQPKQDAATDKERPQQPQIVKTEVETKKDIIPTTDKEASFADICKENTNETNIIYGTEDVATFLASLGL